MRRSSPGRPAPALVVERLVDHYRRANADDLSWMYGQGSVITGLTEDSDIDLILVWDEAVPSASTVPGQSKLTPHGQLLLEQSWLDGYDLDLMHVPRRMFEGWMRELEQGDGWSGDAWPLPIYVAAGLAEAELLLDPTGHGTAHHSRVQIPEAAAVARVRHQLEAAAPGFIKELRRAAERENLWLHASLAVQLHKLIYTAWFLIEGHYPPFPKYLPQWYERFGMNNDVRSLEADYWAACNLGQATTTLEALVAAVLKLPQRQTPTRRRRSDCMDETPLVDLADVALFVRQLGQRQPERPSLVAAGRNQPPSARVAPFS